MRSVAVPTLSGFVHAFFQRETVDTLSMYNRNIVMADIAVRPHVLIQITGMIIQIIRYIIMAVGTV
jgi:hypothetical protein